MNATGQPSAIRRSDLSPDPFTQFDHWFEEAKETEAELPEGMAVTTIGSDGAPSVRMVLLKGFDHRGFRFFTNLESRKAVEIARDQRVALLFWWRTVNRQIRIEGVAEVLPDEESDAYFSTRPRGSQLGAWASPQSEPIDSRELLESRLIEMQNRFAGRAVPRPPYWGGYRVVPSIFEFWHSRGDRLHDRFRYVRQADSWTIQRLAP